MGNSPNPLFRDFYHFMGKKKPWMNPGMHIESREKVKKPLDLWYYLLGVVKDELNMTYLNITDLGFAGPPPLGLFVSLRQMEKKVGENAKNVTS
jgi:hypothetical protein